MAHGPKPRKYLKRMPKKMRHLALRSALSAKTASESLVILDEISFDEPKMCRPGQSFKLNVKNIFNSKFYSAETVPRGG